MRVICVTGMHRSGTSLVMRVLNLLGVEIGPEDQLLPAMPDNPTGFWENRTLTALSDDILRIFGGSWDDPPLLPTGWETSPKLDTLRERAAAALEGLFQGQGSYGWKDPRTSLTLPFWRTITNINASVLVVRRPSQVAASLKRRNGIGPERAAELWLRYVASAFLVDPKRLVLDMEALLSQRQPTIQRLVGFLELPEPDESTVARIEAFIDTSLVHANGVDLSGPRGRLANAVYELLSRGLEDIDPVLQGVATVAETLQLERTLNERELAKRGAAADRLRGELAERGAAADRLRGELAERAAAADRLRGELAERAAAADRLRGELADVYASKSWRFTAPMRAIGRWLRLAIAGRRRL